MRGANTPSSALTLRRFTETRDTNRYSIGEVLSNINPRASSQIDRRLGPPLDYSFCEGQKMADFSRITPREGAHSYISIPIRIPDEDLPPTKPDDIPTHDEDKNIRRNYCKYISNAIRLSNNSLSRYKGFARMLDSVLDNPTELQWIDLSFNDLSCIDECLLEYVELKVLYLHANLVNDITEVDKLARLPSLKTLTLHGNVIDGEKGYRSYVISRIPQLQFLDFSRVTNADREKAKVLMAMNVIGERKRKGNKSSKK